MNNREREQWVANDEGLYRWWKSEGGSLRAFVRRNREAIDDAIRPVISGEKHPHHLLHG